MMNKLIKILAGVGVIGVALAASAPSSEINVYQNKAFNGNEDTSPPISVPKNVEAVRIDFNGTDFIDGTEFSFDLYQSTDGGEYRFLGGQDVVWNGPIVMKNETIDHPYIQIQIPFVGSTRNVIIKTRSPTKGIRAGLKINPITVSSIGLFRVAEAAAAHVQSTVCDGCTTLAYPSNVTAGSMLAVAFRCGGGGAGSGLNFTDTRSNSYSIAIQRGNTADAGTDITISYALNTTAGADTIDPGTSDDACGTRRWGISEYSGVATSGALDQTNSVNFSTSVNSYDTGNIVTTQANELILCAVQVSNSDTETISAPYTRRINGNKISAGEQVVSSTGTYNCTGTVSSDTGSAVIASFKEPGGAPASAVNVNTPAFMEF